jgi:hypothetical protein
MLEIPLIGRGKSYSCLSANSDDRKSVSENIDGVNTSGKQGLSLSSCGPLVPIVQPGLKIPPLIPVVLRIGTKGPSTWRCLERGVDDL